MSPFKCSLVNLTTPQNDIKSCPTIIFVLLILKPKQKILQMSKNLENKVNTNDQVYTSTSIAKVIFYLFTCLSGVKTLFRCQLQRHYSQIYTYFNSILVTHQTPLQNWAIIHLMNFKKPQPDTRNFLMLCGFLCHQNRLTPVSGAQVVHVFKFISYPPILPCDTSINQ